MLEDKIREYIKSRRGKFEPRYRYINVGQHNTPLAAGERLYSGHIHYFDDQENEESCVYESGIVARNPADARAKIRAIAQETLEEGLEFTVSVDEYEYISINGEISKVEHEHN